MHRTVVVARLGDKAASYTPEQFAASFEALTSTVPVTSATIADAGDPLRLAIHDGAHSANVTDARKELADARAARLAKIENAHRGTVASAN